MRCAGPSSSSRDPFRIVLGDLESTTAALRLRLPPLSPEAVQQLAAPRGMDADDLYAKTAGNPFFVTEALAGGADAIPATVRDAVLARAARLSPRTRRLLEAVAVASPQAEFWLLERVADGLLDELETCLASGMLTADEGGVAFRHELARLAIEESLSPTRRVDLHRATLAALESHVPESRRSTSPGWPIMPRQHATSRVSFSTRPRQGTMQASSAPPARLPPSTRARFASPSTSA